MDSVRFGRALGIGAREAAKAVAKAADAAATPGPSSAAGARPPAPARVVEKVVESRAQVAQATQNVVRGSRAMGASVWKPLAKVSGVLWLEVTGVFFGLFLMVAAGNAWKLRGNLRDTGLNHGAHVGLEWSIAMAILFGYFCVSSFVRARRASGG